jgi:hypothetical protein
MFAVPMMLYLLLSCNRTPTEHLQNTYRTPTVCYPLLKLLAPLLYLHRHLHSGLARTGWALALELRDKSVRVHVAQRLRQS